MKKLQTFFYVFKNSITSPKYYNDILKTNLGFSIKYFVLLSAFASIIFSAIVSINGIPETKKFINTFAEQVKDVYPNDLVIDFKDGAWNINQEEPYIIPMPEFPDVGTEEIPQNNLIVFDKKGTIDDLERYNTVSILNETNLVYKDQTEKITAQPIKEVPNFTLDKPTLISKLDEMYKYLKLVPYFVPVLLFTADFLFNYLGEGVFHILLAGLVIYLFSLIRKEKIDYKSACKIVIHTMTVPIIIQLGLRFTEFNTLIVGWFFMLNVLIAIVFMVKMGENVNIKKIEKNEEKIEE